MRTKAPIVVVEGIDGSGKTSMAAVIADELSKMGWSEVAVTHEPDDPDIRALFLKDPSNAEFVAALMYADRVRHTAKVKGLSESGTAVVMDRYWPSTVAYQGGTDIAGLSRYFLNVPDLYVFLRLPVKKAMARIEERMREAQKAMDPLETYTVLTDASYAYRKVADDLDNSVVIDASLPLDDVEEAVRKAVYMHLPLNL